MQEIKNNFLDSESIVNKPFFDGIKEMVQCVICTGVIFDPMQCTSCENAFCKKCILNWQSKSSTCPFKCNTFAIKEGARTLKGLLEKLIFRCQNYCSSGDEFTYEKICKHLQICENMRVFCKSCGSYVRQTQIVEPEEIKLLKDKIVQLELMNTNLRKKNQELEEEVEILSKNNSSSYGNGLNQKGSILKASSRNSTSLPCNFNIKEKYKDYEMGLINKCDHFKGNYKPIFACCNKAFSCYICHNEAQSHSYEFSNKVVCLICNNIYTGSKCTKCNAIQVYKQKSF